MTSQYILPKTTVYNVEYNIPRVVVGVPGRQNRSGDGRLRITPGMTEPIEFIWGNFDGVPLNLGGFQVKLIFWTMENLGDTARPSPDVQSFGPGHSKIVLTKKIELQDPHGGRGTVLIMGEETFALHRQETHGLRWGLFLINDTGNIFPTQVTSSGARWGTVLFDRDSGIPSPELIKNSA
jgi:hypothetical protein